jgi:hypothetical protein
MKELVLYSTQIIPVTDKVDVHLLALIEKPSPTVGYIPSRSDTVNFSLETFMKTGPR